MPRRNACAVLFVAAGILPSQIHAQSARKFEVASIKPCNSGDVAPSANGKKAIAGRGRVIGSPGRLNVECRTVADLIRDAYLNYAKGEPWPQPVGSLSPVGPVSSRLANQDLRGSPGWVNRERYTIEAAAVGGQRVEMMRGPMMQALLEDRFQLKLHRETREIPVYELTVEKGGPKLTASRDGSCIAIGPGHPPPPDPGPSQPFPRICGGFLRDDLNGSTIANLCYQFSVMMDRDVIDKTGITGVFDIHLDSFWEHFLPRPPADGALGPANPPGPPIRPDPAEVFAAAQISLKKLGLKLEAARGSGEFLVIDHVERPSEN